MFNDVVVFVFFLLFDADAVDFFDIEFRAAVEDGQFGSVDLDETVVDAGGVESCHGVFDCADNDIAFTDDCAAVCSDHIVGYSIDDRLAVKIDTLYFISVVFRRRAECRIDLRACMKTFAA